MISDTVSIGALLAFPWYVDLLFRPVRLLADKFNTLQMGMVAADRVFDVMDSREQINDNGYREVTDLKGDISYSDVSFAYDGKNNVVSDINFKVNAGETLAVVGSTGSGKSTLINLLSRFYDIEHGEIAVDGQDIRTYKLNQLRSRMAIVLQDVFLFYGSVLENITLNDPNITMDRVLQASKAIGADSYIQKLSDGYDHMIMERGANLSVGQRQLISFVRALVFDPDILILDEATSSIDTETEEVIQYAIEKLIEKRTSIIIAHRLSTIRHADAILVMDHGKVVEHGHHNELVQIADGRYKELYDMQFSNEMAE